MALFNAGINFERAGKNHDAIVSYKRTMQTNDKNSASVKDKAQKLLAKLYQEAGLFEDAAKMFRKMAKDNPKDPLASNYIYNSAKVLNSSHTLVFCTRTDISAEYLEQLLQQDELNGRFKDETAKQGQRDTRKGYVEFYRNELKNLSAWMENQTVS